MKQNKFSGLTGVALAGFFRGVQEKVVQKRVVDVELKPNGRVSPEWLIGWAKTRGYSAEKLQNGKIRVGVVVTP